MSLYYVYLITNTNNDKVYVGSTKNFKKRIQDHISALRSSRHPNRKLQEEWSVYGEKCFDFKAVDLAETQERAFDKEQFWMDYYQAYLNDFGYNISPTAMKTLGRRHTDEAKLKMSESHKGKKLDENHKDKISDAMKKHVKSDEHKENVVKALLKKRTEGMRHNFAKLTEDDVVEIIALLNEGYSSSAIAKEYNVSYTTISNIKKGISWKHVVREAR